MTFSEDQVGVKLDRCVSDTIIKGKPLHTFIILLLAVQMLEPQCNAAVVGTAGGGLLIGSVMSLLFFKRRVWPVWLGSGFGVGVAYSTCEKNLNSSK